MQVQTMNKLKLIVAVIVIVITIIVILQNTELVETEILFIKIAMPQALLLLLALLIGFVTGLGVSAMVSRRRR